MEIGEAESFVDNLRPNIEALDAMPDEALRAQAIGALLGSSEAVEAKDAFLEDLNQKIAGLAIDHVVTEQDMVEQPLDTKGQSELDEFEAVMAFFDADPECEPAKKSGIVQKTDDKIHKLASDHAIDLTLKAREINRQTHLAGKGLGQKKLSRLQGQSEKKLQKLASRPPEGQDAAHIALHPALFSETLDVLINRSRDDAVPDGEREVCKQLGLILMASGEKYIAENADKLQNNTDFVSQMLVTVAEEMVLDSDVIGPAGHLLRGFYSSVHTPEQAVNRHNSIIKAMIEGPKDTTVARVGAEILLFYPEFFERIDFIENYSTVTALSGLGVIDDLVRVSLTQAMSMEYLRHNLGLNDPLSRYTQLEKMLSERISNRVVQIASAKGKGANVKDYRQEIVREGKVLDKIIATDSGEDTQPFRSYLRDWFTNAVTSGEAMDEEYQPVLRRMAKNFQTFDELSNRYNETFGYNHFDPARHSVHAINGDFVLDVLWTGDLSELPEDIGDAKKLAAGKIDDVLHAVSVYNSDPDGWMDGYQEFNKADAVLSNFGSRPYVIDEGEGYMALVRRRTVYDDEVLSTNPLNDFVIKAFNTTEPLPTGLESKKRIEQYRKRFVPRRGVQVVINDQEVRDSGLTSLVLKSGGGNRVIVEATIHGKPRAIQIKDGVFYSAFGVKVAGVGVGTEVPGYAFLDYCMHALSEWMCRPVIETSEGTIEEGKDGPIRGGYFGYLGLKKDGSNSNRSDKQWEFCATERNLDLDEESDRRRPLDPTGKGRNSTYYKEDPDDGEHLPPLRVYLNN